MASYKISKLIDGVVVDGLSFLHNKEEIVEGCRLFYEVTEGYWGKGYKQTGIYKEIDDPVYMAMNDDFLDEFWYIRHHGFLIKHKENE